MIIVKELELNDENKVSIKEIITNPKLWALTYGQGNKAPDDFVLEEEFVYIGIFWDHQLIGIFQYKEFTKITMECHIYMLPQYWGTGTSHEAVKLGHKYLLQHTGYRTILITVPSSCTHVLQFMANIHYKVCGAIPNGIIYDNHKRDLLLFTHSLIEEV